VGGIKDKMNLGWVAYFNPTLYIERLRSTPYGRSPFVDWVKELNSTYIIFITLYIYNANIPLYLPFIILNPVNHK